MRNTNEKVKEIFDKLKEDFDGISDMLIERIDHHIIKLQEEAVENKNKNHYGHDANAISMINTLAANIIRSSSYKDSMIPIISQSMQNAGLDVIDIINEAKEGKVCIPCIITKMQEEIPENLLTPCYIMLGIYMYKLVPEKDIEKLYTKLNSN